MITPNDINSAGLVLDIIGALLLWRYGLPEPVSRSGAIHIVTEQIDQSEVVKAKRYDQLSRLALALLILGFLLQILSNYWSKAT